MITYDVNFSVCWDNVTFSLEYCIIKLWFFFLLKNLHSIERWYWRYESTCIGRASFETYTLCHRYRVHQGPSGKIRDLMVFSDLENLLSIGRIFYQLGESYLNLFLLHKVENLWSVRNLWSIFTSLSALEDFLSDLGEGERGGERAFTPI